MAEIIERDGKIYILDSWESDYRKPVQYRLVWPTGLCASFYPNFIGMECSCIDAGVYRIDGTGTMIQLEDGGQTMPEKRYYEERKIRKPCNCTDYRDGKWRK